MLLEVEGDADTRLDVRSEAGSWTMTLPQLLTASQGRFVGGLASPALVVQRAVPEREWALVLDERITPPEAGSGFVYLRLLQADGQAAWASPVFLD